MMEAIKLRRLDYLINFTQPDTLRNFSVDVEDDEPFESAYMYSVGHGTDTKHSFILIKYDMGNFDDNNKKWLKESTHKVFNSMASGFEELVNYLNIHKDKELTVVVSQVYGTTTDYRIIEGKEILDIDSYDNYMKNIKTIPYKFTVIRNGSDIEEEFI